MLREQVFCKTEVLCHSVRSRHWEQSLVCQTCLGLVFGETVPKPCWGTHSALMCRWVVAEHSKVAPCSCCIDKATTTDVWYDILKCNGEQHCSAFPTGRAGHQRHRGAALHSSSRRTFLVSTSAAPSRCL